MTQKELVSDEDYDAILNFFPKLILNFLSSKTKLHCKFFSKNISESLIFKYIWKQFQVCNNLSSITSNLQIYFIEGKSPIVYLYQDFQIYDNLKGLRYDDKKDEIENSEFLINFISKSQMLFGEFNIEIFFFETKQEIYDIEVFNIKNKTNIDIPNECQKSSKTCFKFIVDLEILIRERCKIGENHYIKIFNRKDIQQQISSFGEITIT